MYIGNLESKRKTIQKLLIVYSWTPKVEQILRNNSRFASHAIRIASSQKEVKKLNSPLGKKPKVIKTTA